MIKSTLQYCATDKEIFDALMSAKQKISKSVLQEIAKDRGILLSAQDSREDLIGFIALLPHDYHDLNTLLEQREHSGRQEKLTSITLKENLNPDEIREILKEYATESPVDERLTHQSKGSRHLVATVNYVDVDYSKTRLIQRTPKEAEIEFHVEKEKTTIRMPANERALGIFEKIKDKLDSKKKKEIQALRIELSEFESPTLRTEFFTSLISGLEGFSLDNVTSVKVERLKQEPEEQGLELEDDQENEEAKQEALALVKKVALRGETLLASEEFQSFTKRDFFITSIIWRSRSNRPPYPLIEFEAAFEHPIAGKGFKYFVRGSYNVVGGHLTKTMRPVDADSKESYLCLIEKTADETVAKLREKVKSLQVGDELHNVGEAT